MAIILAVAWTWAGIAALAAAVSAGLSAAGIFLLFRGQRLAAAPRLMVRFGVFESSLRGAEAVYRPKATLFNYGSGTAYSIQVTIHASGGPTDAKGRYTVPVLPPDTQSDLKLAFKVPGGRVPGFFVGPVKKRQDLQRLRLTMTAVDALGRRHRFRDLEATMPGSKPRLAAQFLLAFSPRRRKAMSFVLEDFEPTEGSTSL